MSITGAVLTAVMADVLLPEKWRKYVRIITGLIIIATIISPLKSITIPDVDIYKREADELSYDGEALRHRLIVEELQKNIEADICLRIDDELGESVGARVEIAVNANDEITGVERIKITGANEVQNVKEILDKVYSPKEVIFDEY